MRREGRDSNLSLSSFPRSVSAFERGRCFSPRGGNVGTRFTETFVRLSALFLCVTDIPDDHATAFLFSSPSPVVFFVFTS